jgi:cytochrome c oxidase subunit 3
VNVTAGFAGLIAGLLLWWMIVRRLTARPWEATAASGSIGDGGSLRVQPAKVGLWIFLAVVTSFFGLFITAYVLRMSPHEIPDGVLRDWRPLDDPQVLWLNTILLVLASAGMQLARSAADRDLVRRNATGMAIGGFFALAFLVGQWVAWRQLRSAGFYAAGNPSYAFFYVLTGLHGLHLLGGLVVWARAVGRMLRGDSAARSLRLTVELCSIYWHYLLVVWLVLFGLLLIT